MKRILFLFVVSSLIFSCDFVGGERIDGNGNKSSEQRQLNNFSSIEASGALNIVVKQEANFAIKVEGDENLLQYIVTTVNNGVLKVRTKEGINLHSNHDIIVYVSAPKFTEINLSGSGNIVSENTLESDKLSFEMSGSGNIDVRVNTTDVRGSLSGSGNMALSGTATNFTATVAGSGNIRCYGLNTETTKINIAGNGDAEVYASKLLKADVAGSGDIRYKGSAEVQSNVAGSGGVTKAN